MPNIQFYFLVKLYRNLLNSTCLFDIQKIRQELQHKASICFWKIVCPRQKKGAILKENMRDAFARLSYLINKDLG